MEEDAAEDEAFEEEDDEDALDDEELLEEALDDEALLAEDEAFDEDEALLTDDEAAEDEALLLDEEEVLLLDEEDEDELLELYVQLAVPCWMAVMISGKPQASVERLSCPKISLEPEKALLSHRITGIRTLAAPLTKYRACLTRSAVLFLLVAPHSPSTTGTPLAIKAVCRRENSESSVAVSVKVLVPELFSAKSYGR